MNPATKTTEFDNLINGHPMRPTPITVNGPDGAFVVRERQEVRR